MRRRFSAVLVLPICSQLRIYGITRARLSPALPDADISLYINQSQSSFYHTFFSSFELPYILKTFLTDFLVYLRFYFVISLSRVTLYERVERMRQSVVLFTRQ